MVTSGDPGRGIDYSRKGDFMNEYSEGYWKKYAETLRGIIILQNAIILITFVMIGLILVLS